MNNTFSISTFLQLFPDEVSCLEAVRKQRYPNGMFCAICNRETLHYKLKNRMAYTCKFCRNQIYPLAGTMFEKTTTPLMLWFFAMFLMIHTRADISARQLQRELGVTYKTAWRMRRNILILMQQNNGDLILANEEKERVHKWTFFNKLELRVVQKQGRSR